MKKVLLSTWIIGVGIAVGVGLISLYGVGDTKEALGQALRVITAPQGGTGISTSSPTDVGKCIMVLDDSPFTYKLDDCGGLGSDPTVIQVDGAAQSVDSPTLNYTSNSFTVVENPDDTFTLRVATTTLGLLTTNVGEGTNLYYTDVRARAAITESVLGLEFNAGVLGTTTDYFLPTTTRASNWDTAYSWGDHALASYLTTVDISSNTNLTADGTNVVLTGDALSLGSNLLLSYASSTGISGTNVNFTNGVVTYATSTNLAATTVFNFLGTIITNVATWFSTTLNAVSSFVAAASSTWDFGGATSLELPNGTGPTVDATGEIALDTTSDQVKFYGASSAKVLGNGNDYSTFTYATTTAWTGTTTIPLGVAIVAETWNAISCFTDAGTLNIGVGDGTNWTNNTAASTTAGLTTLTSNNTFTALEKRYVRMGTPSGAPTTTSCTISRSLTAD